MVYYDISMNKKNIIALIVCIVIPQLIGMLGAVFTFSALSLWYEPLVKPALNPPAWIFGPVWTVLYMLMGVAAFLVWKKGYALLHVKIALVLFIIQLALNALWSVLFFGLHNPGMAFAEIIMLWIAILFTLLHFYKISRTAAYLLIPYILWVSFAGYLSYSIWVIN